ncbi:MAG TPA: hypothetical protein VGD80_41130, partial [Kofleriaceae bacterium]
MSATRTFPASGPTAGSPRLAGLVWVVAPIFASIFVLGCARRPPVAPLPPLPRDVYALYLDGKLAGYKGDWAAAADALSEAAARAPDQPMVAVELARAQMKAKRT